jgi:ATP-dependent Clp protease protease subunit
VEFKYTIDPTAERPIMLIDKHIGYDEEDGEGIMGDQFSRELLFLDTLNKSCIDIYMNTPGGSVVDGQLIYNTILKTKTKVNTHNIGMCASIGLPIFLAGRNRYMMDNATAMLHPLSGGDHKSRTALETAVNTMFTSRSIIPAEKITEMMNRTTWLTANDCGPEGLNICEVEYSGNYNKPRKTPDAEGIKASWKDYASVVNKLIEEKKPIKMANIKVNNKLKLNPDANEDSQVAAIEQIENRANTAESKLTALEVENKAKVDALNSQLADLKTQKEAVEAKLKELEDKDKDAAKVANKARAEELVKNLVATGRIVDEPEIVKDWTDQAIENYDRTKKVTDALPINKKKAAIEPPVNFQRQDPEGSQAPSIDVKNTGAFVARMNAKISNKALERFK